MLIANELLPDLRILKDIQILVVDNDRDNRDLYALFLGSYSAKVTTLESIKDTLALLDWFIPDILICEIRFFGENVYPLIERVRYLARSHNRTIPILVTSTCSLANFTQQLTVRVEAYLRKPIDLDDFVDEIWHLVSLSRIACSLNIQD